MTKGPATRPNANVDDPRGAKKMDWDKTDKDKTDKVDKTAEPKERLHQSMFLQKSNMHFATRYQKGVKLGSGAYGEVWSCIEKSTNIERAIKIIPKELTTGADKKIDFVNEVEVLKTLDHPNIMKIYACGEDDKNCYIVTDVYLGGELFDEIIRKEKFTEIFAAYFMQQILSGVQYLHKRNIVHRDIKPENLLLDSKSPHPLIKIIDFGLSTIVHATAETSLKDRVGSAYYIAPEVLKQEYGKKCDIWSSGVILYVLLSGSPPFPGEDDYEIISNVKSGRYSMSPDTWGNISAEAKDLISKMMEVNVKKRYTAVQCLEHPWFQKFPDIASNKHHKPLMNALKNMRAYQANQSLMKAATLFMGSMLTNHKDTMELTRVFRMLDKNSDGKLDRSELTGGYMALIQARGFCHTLFSGEDIAAEVDSVLESVDLDGSGSIEYSEFITAAMDRSQMFSKERMVAAFQAFDKDNSGAIDLKEIRQYLPDLSDAEWKSTILDVVDENGDGEVDFEEFMKMMNTYTLPKSAKK